MTAPSFSLDGKVALVTGARSGIGAAIAVAFAAAGADLVLHGHRDDLEATRRSVEALGRRARTWIADLAEPHALASEIDELLDGQVVDVLVHNAGIVERIPTVEVPHDSWRRVLSVNLDAAFVLAQRIGGPMVERRSGKVIFIASMCSFQGGTNQVSYTASKHGVVGLTRALSNEWAPSNVQVNALAPGYIATDLTEALTSDATRSAEIRARIPAGRWGRPEDLAGAAVFLASPAADYMTGQVLCVDGGWLAR